MFNLFGSEHIDVPSIDVQDKPIGLDIKGNENFWSLKGIKLSEENREEMRDEGLTVGKAGSYPITPDRFGPAIAFSSKVGGTIGASVKSAVMAVKSLPMDATVNDAKEAIEPFRF